MYFCQFAEPDAARKPNSQNNEEKPYGEKKTDTEREDIIIEEI